MEGFKLERNLSCQTCVLTSETNAKVVTWYGMLSNQISNLKKRIAWLVCHRQTFRYVIGESKNLWTNLSCYIGSDANSKHSEPPYNQDPNKGTQGTSNLYLNDPTKQYTIQKQKNDVWFLKYN